MHRHGRSWFLQFCRFLACLALIRCIGGKKNETARGDLGPRELKAHSLNWTFAPRPNKGAPRRSFVCDGGLRSLTAGCPSGRRRRSLRPPNPLLSAGVKGCPLDWGHGCAQFNGLACNSLCAGGMGGRSRRRCPFWPLGQKGVVKPPAKPPHRDRLFAKRACERAERPWESPRAHSIRLRTIKRNRSRNGGVQMIGGGCSLTR